MMRIWVQIQVCAASGGTSHSANPHRPGPISGLNATGHRNLRRGLCSEECLPEYASSLLVWKLTSCCTFTHLFTQHPLHAGHCSVAGDAKINKGGLEGSHS